MAGWPWPGKGQMSWLDPPPLRLPLRNYKLHYRNYVTTLSTRPKTLSIIMSLRKHDPEAKEQERVLQVSCRLGGRIKRPAPC